jgi:hypothetical protein
MSKHRYIPFFSFEDILSSSINIKVICSVSFLRYDGCQIEICVTKP